MFVVWDYSVFCPNWKILYRNTKVTEQFDRTWTIFLILFMWKMQVVLSILYNPNQCHHR